MKTTQSLKAGLLALTLGFGYIGAASADAYRHGHHRYAPPARHYQHDNRGYGNLAAAIVVTGLIGAAIMSASSPPAPAPVYVAPPAPPVQQVWYFCPPTGAYYPNARHCPGGWQAVAPQPRW